MAVLLGAGLFGASAFAQVYRIVGPDGRVTFSDRPPPDGTATTAKALPLPGMPVAGGVALPTELRNAVSRFPIVLYTGVNCAPCVSAREYLTGRGVPFTEKTVSSEDDIAALKRLAGVSRVPFATIGGQHVRGFSEVEWAEYLDAAGYPKVSQLPPSYRNPPATPLVAVQAAPAARQAPARPAQAEGPQAPAETPDNPAGIRF
jgi:glutaredoxin